MESILTLLVAVLALHHLLHGAQNLVNLNPAHQAVAAVLGQAEAPVYPRSIMPPLRHPALAWTALGIIIGLQFAAGALLTRAAWMMGTAQGSAVEFVAASESAFAGCAVALLLWFGLFLTLGAALFQMWQTGVGEGAMRGAFQNGMFSTVVMLALMLGNL